ncbi:hypothetical protein BJF84_15905 [Rhodococcus sp. CUA-806]|nr:hypothetical protein BJF84_15905 [Rhodococcus sp. CUA-806]
MAVAVDVDRYALLTASEGGDADVLVGACPDHWCAELFEQESRFSSAANGWWVRNFWLISMCAVCTGVPTTTVARIGRTRLAADS